jgi:predicted phage terminase large subunit-like protein
VGLLPSQVAALQKISLTDISAEKCRRRFYWFYIEFWETIEPVEFENNWHIEYICDQLQEAYERWERGESQADIYINVPPGTSKSTMCTQLFPAWLWVRNKGIRIISSSYAADISVEHAVKSRNCITSDKFKLYFGDEVTIKAGEDNKTNYKNTGMGQRFVTSTGSAVTGQHADFILIDDPINPKGAESDVQRQAALDHISKTLSTRKTNKKRSITIVIMQRLHAKDPTGLALKKGGINHICLPGRISEKIRPVPESVSEKYVNGLLDPKRLDEEALAKMRGDLGSYGFAGQVEQNPSPEGGGQIKSAWFPRISYAEFMEIKGVAVPYFFLDTAYTKKQSNDPSALLTAYKIGGNYYIVDSEQQWKEFPALIKHIKSYVSRMGYARGSKIMVEPKASGISIVDQVKDETELNIFKLPAPTDDKITRVSGVAPKLESGRVILTDGNWVDNFLAECNAFPNGEHDDQVDNLVNMINYFESQPTGGIKATTTR